MKAVAAKGRIGTPSTAEDERWRAEDDLRTLSRAEEIRRDRQRMKATKRHLKNMHRAVHGRGQSKRNAPDR